jgi:hypothetical protein
LPIRLKHPILLYLACFAGFLFFAAAHSPELLSGGLRWNETISEYIPWRVEAGRQIAQGEFPFFTSKVFGGLPMYSTSYIGILYPPNWLYSFSPPSISNWLYVFHMAFGALGMFAYLRSRRLVPFVAFTGGLMFVSCTFFLVHHSHISMIETGLWAPWVVFFARRLLIRPGPGRAVALALAIALQISVGY